MLPALRPIHFLGRSSAGNEAGADGAEPLIAMGLEGVCKPTRAASLHSAPLRNFAKSARLRDGASAIVQTSCCDSGISQAVQGASATTAASGRGNLGISQQTGPLPQGALRAQLCRRRLQVANASAEKGGQALVRVVRVGLSRDAIRADRNDVLHASADQKRERERLGGTLRHGSSSFVGRAGGGEAPSAVRAEKHIGGPQCLSMIRSVPCRLSVSSQVGLQLAHTAWGARLSLRSDRDGQL